MTSKLSAILATAAIAGAAALTSLPAQAGGVSWGVSIGVPGFGVYAGQPGGGFGPRPYVRPWVPARVFVAPPVYFGPPVTYRPYYGPVVRTVPVWQFPPRVGWRRGY